MKTKKVNRYYCDFCKKSGCSGGHMKKHEIHCTMNPNRACRVCLLLGVHQQPMSELLATLPKPASYNFDPLEAFEGVTLAMPLLRRKANNCPACILATLRQSGLIGITYIDYKQEMRDIFASYDDKYH